MELSLSGKVALITGGSKGIGKSIAKTLARSGARVAICARGIRDLEQTSAEIASETGTECFAVQADLGSLEGCRTFVNRVVDRYGRADVLVCCANVLSDRGGTFSTNEWGGLGLNEAGDVALAFSLEPLSNPLGVNVGAYRWSHTSQTLTPLLVPKVTPAPGGGTFAGTGFSVALNNQGEIAFQGFTATDKGIHISTEPYVGYGEGVYTVDAQGKIAAVAVPVVLHLTDNALAGVAEDAQMFRQPEHASAEPAVRQSLCPGDKSWLGSPITAAVQEDQDRRPGENVRKVAAEVERVCASAT